MMRRINPEMKIRDVLESYPETLEVFNANGFQAAAKEDLIDQLSPLLTLGMALKVKGLNTELFINLLEEKITENQVVVQCQDDEAAMKRLNFFDRPSAANCSCRFWYSFALIL